MKTQRKLLSVLISSVLLSPLAIHAQETETKDNIEVIQVSAQKRQQSIQDVPISMSAFDDKKGERVLAYVTTTGNISTEAILAHCKNNLTGYKLPKEIHIIEQLPKSSVGKILRKELR